LTQNETQQPLSGQGPSALLGLDRLDGRVRLRGWCQGSIGRVAAGWHGFSIHVVPRPTAVSTKIKASWRRR